MANYPTVSGANPQYADCGFCVAFFLIINHLFQKILPGGGFSEPLGRRPPPFYGFIALNLATVRLFFLILTNSASEAMEKPLSLADIRKNYSREVLSEQSVLPDPVQQFEVWLNEALKAGVEEATAMVLATATPEGKPSSRVVLLKGIEQGSFIFFTNYLSRKGQQLAANPQAAITFFWPGVERQVRLEGTIRKLDETASDMYFHSRPKASQIGAWASPQSQEVESRTELERAEQHYAEKFKASVEIPRPENWGGFQFLPAYFEFWQGRPSRLHDRIVYEKEKNGSWQLKRLAP